MRSAHAAAHNGAGSYRSDREELSKGQSGAAANGNNGASGHETFTRIQRHLVDLSTDLGIGLVQATILLGSFITVLWTLSEMVNFSIDRMSFTIPGYMVWCALVLGVRACGDEPFRDRAVMRFAAGQEDGEKTAPSICERMIFVLR